MTEDECGRGFRVVWGNPDAGYPRLWAQRQPQGLFFPSSPARKNQMSADLSENEVGKFEALDIFCEQEFRYFLAAYWRGSVDR